MAIVVVAVMLLLAVAAYKFGNAVSSAIINLSGASSRGGKDDMLAKIQDTFFNTVFVLLGYIAKSDGRVNRVEIKLTESYMDKMALSADRRHMAIELFHLGAKREFNPTTVLKNFCKIARPSPDQREIMLVYLINLARMDGVLVDGEMREIQEVADHLGFSGVLFKQLLRMLSAHATFADSPLYKQAHKQSGTSEDASFQADAKASTSNGNAQSEKQSRSDGQHQSESDSQRTEDATNNAKSTGVPTDALLTAYEVLGLLPNASDAEVKKAYRRLVNQYHPDKLVGQGLPDFVLMAMAEHFQVVQAAYELIKQRRAAAKAA